jgi:hypothetical protein
MAVIFVGVGAKCREESAELSGWLPWWQLAGSGESGDAFFNNRGGVPDLAGLLPSRRGGDWRDDVLDSSAPREDLAALCGVHQRWRLFSTVILGRSGHSVLGYHLCPSSFNLQAGVPKRRPYISSAAEICVDPSPSGLVPGDGAGGRRVELGISIGGEGPDCFLQVLDRVLFAKSEDLFAFHFYFMVLNVNCKPTD